jgi:hypothetical protein
MAEVWDNCDNYSWLMWMCRKSKVNSDYSKLSAKFVREIWHLLKDDRSKAAIEAVENGTLTAEIRKQARDAANAANAAYAAYAAAANDAYADAAAANDAAAAADAAAANDAAAAADAAAASTYAAAYADYAADAKGQLKQKFVQIIKQHIPNPFKE